MANKLSIYFILIALLVMFACIRSDAQLSYPRIANISVIDENGTKVCSKGMELCSGVCTNISTELNCGGCADKPHQWDHVCKPEQKCCNGACCLPDEICCRGKCTDTYNDPNNCGGCGNAESGKNICQPDEICCSGTCANTLIDDNNCGECGYICSAGAYCRDGECLSSSTAEMDAGVSDEEPGDASE